MKKLARQPASSINLTGLNAGSVSGLACALSLVLSVAAEAQPRSASRQAAPAARSSATQRSEMVTVKRVKESGPKKWFSNYFAEFTGPSADFALPLESFSTGADYYAPMALYQSLDLGYLIDSNHKLGIGLSANKPLQDEVLDRYYNYYSSEFTFFDPGVFLQANNLFTNSWSWVNTKLSVDLPVSEFSRKVEKITTFYIGPVWNFRLPFKDWYASLNLDLYYNLYQNPQGWNRFSSGVGHSLGYYINPQWHIDTTSIFDFAMVSQGNQMYSFATGSVDRMKITLRYQPVLNQVQIGLFAITPIYDRGLDRTAVGLNSNLWF